MKILLLFTIFIFASREAEAHLEVFSDDDLLNLLNTEKFVVVLFSEYFRLVRLRFKIDIGLDAYLKWAIQLLGVQRDYDE